VSGPAQSWGYVSSDDAGHVNSRRPSRFLPLEFRWTDTNKRKTNSDTDFASGLKLKSFDCTGVMYHRKNWQMIPKRGGACQTILYGKFYFPTAKQGVAHYNHPNLKSVDEDKTLSYRMICKYLISGALEFCPPGFKPTNLAPLGLVPKKDVDKPFRVIADGRQLNEYMLPWKTEMREWPHPQECSSEDPTRFSATLVQRTTTCPWVHHAIANVPAAGRAEV